MVEWCILYLLEVVWMECFDVFLNIVFMCIEYVFDVMLKLIFVFFGDYFKGGW